MSPLSHTAYSLLLTIFLIPCAIQDWRIHRVTNWLTIPAFGLAWIAAFWLENLPLTVAVFGGCYIAWQLRWMGAADGKLATLMAAVAPGSLLVSALLLAVTFLVLRLKGQSDQQLPAAVWFCAGSGLYLLYLLL